MDSMVYSELLNESVQLAIYLITAVGAFLSMVFFARA